MTSGDSALSHSQLFSRAQDTKLRSQGCTHGSAQLTLQQSRCSGQVGGCSAHSSTSALPKGHISVQSPLHPGMTDGTVCVLSGKPSSALTFDKWLCQGYLCASITPLPRNFIRISPFLPSPWTAREAGQSAARHRPVPCRYSHVSRQIPGAAGQVAHDPVQAARFLSHPCQLLPPSRCFYSLCRGPWGSHQPERELSSGHSSGTGQ